MSNDARMKGRSLYVRMRNMNFVLKPMEATGMMKQRAERRVKIKLRF
jgi:hypothetical protein